VEMYKDLLTTLMQRLIGLAGLETALNLARQIPAFEVDRTGHVLAYDRETPHLTASQLIEFCEAYSQPASQVQEPVKAAVDLAKAMGGTIQADTTLSSPVRILLVDDHALVREGLISLINPQPDLQVVGEAGSVREAITMAHSLRPDVILMDFTLPDGKGDEATRVILSALPEIKIIFLTVHDDDERLFAAISAGATGYLLKSVRSADLLNRLRGVIRGDVALSPSIGRRILEQLSHQPKRRSTEPGVGDELTEREIEVLRFIVQGHTNRQIADRLNLSVRTVEYHRANLTSKLGLHSRADLVRYAAEHGLLDIQDAPAKTTERRDRH
jgi:two-component system, NarL family, response regulator NreC